MKRDYHKSNVTALGYVFVKRSIYDKWTDRMESKVQRLKAELRTVRGDMIALKVQVQAILDELTSPARSSEDE